MKNILRKILLCTNNNFSKLNDGDYLLPYSIPYQCQFASPELVKDIIYKKINTKDDPKWRDFGFKTRNEYAYWSQNACGIACLKMIIESMASTKISYAVLVEASQKKKAFIDDVGWIHDGLIRIAEDFGFKGTAKTSSIKNICKVILGDHFVIASVSPQLGEKDSAIKYFGHLVLIVGFKITDGKVEGIYINNPSGREESLREKAFIPLKRFKLGYAGRIIILRKK